MVGELVWGAIQVAIDLVVDLVGDVLWPGASTSGERFRYRRMTDDHAKRRQGEFLRGRPVRIPARCVVVADKAFPSTQLKHLPSGATKRFSVDVVDGHITRPRGFAPWGLPNWDVLWSRLGTTERTSRIVFSDSGVTGEIVSLAFPPGSIALIAMKAADWRIVEGVLNAQRGVSS